MSPKLPETQEDIEKALDDLIVYLKQAKTQIEADVEVDLDGLDYTVQNVCDAVKQAPQDIKDTVEAKMTVMVKYLEALADALKQHPDVVTPTDTDE